MKGPQNVSGAAVTKDMRVFRKNEWTEMPWKNGGGTTNEIYREGEGETPALRFSIAEVNADGPFSVFEGVDRTIVMLSGGGFLLGRPDGKLQEITSVGVPFSFSGDDSWSCSLIAGPVSDFNVMADRKTVATSTTLVALSHAVTLADARRFWLALEACTISANDKSVTLGQWDLLETEGPLEIRPRDPVRTALLCVEVRTV